MPIFIDFPFEPVTTNVGGEVQESPYLRAFISGGLEGALDFWKVIKHPFDHLVYPASLFFHDVVVLSSGLNPVDKEGFGSSEIKESKTFRDAYSRMELRFDHFVQCGVDFKMASGPDRVQMISRLAVNFFLPGAIVKGAVRLKVAPAMHEKFGVFTPPARFEPHFVFDSPLDPSRFRLYNYLNIPSNGSFIYIVDLQGNLRIAPYRFDEAFSIPGLDKSPWLSHSELAQGQPVIAAGQVITRDGKIRSIDSQSGYYHPRGSHLRKVVETVFENHGFQEAKGTFVKRGEIFSPGRPKRVQENPFLPIAIERSIRISFLAIRAIDESLQFENYPGLDPFLSDWSKRPYAVIATSSVFITESGVFRRESDSSFITSRVKNEANRLELIRNPDQDFFASGGLSDFLTPAGSDRKPEDLYSKLDQMTNLLDGPIRRTEDPLHSRTLGFVKAPISHRPSGFDRLDRETSIPSIVDSLYRREFDSSGSFREVFSPFAKASDKKPVVFTTPKFSTGWGTTPISWDSRSSSWTGMTPLHAGASSAKGWKTTPIRSHGFQK